MAAASATAAGSIAGTAALTPGSGHCSNVDLLGLDVLRHIDEDGAGTAGEGYGEGPGDDREQLGGALDEKIVLGDGKRHPVGIDLLKGVRADHRRGHLAGDRDEGNGIELRVRQGGDEVRRPRTGRGEADARLSGRPRDAVGDEAGPLLVPREDMAYRAFGERVVEGEVGAPRNAATIVTPALSSNPMMISAPLYRMSPTSEKEIKKAPAGLHRQGPLLHEIKAYGGVNR